MKHKNHTIQKKFFWSNATPVSQESNHISILFLFYYWTNGNSTAYAWEISKLCAKIKQGNSDSIILQNLQSYFLCTEI